MRLTVAQYLDTTARGTFVRDAVRMLACAARWRMRGDKRAAALYLNKAAQYRACAARCLRSETL